MPNSPAFQFYPSDFIAGTLDFSLEQRGAYLVLLCWSWEHGVVPKNPRQLANILGLSRYKLAALLPVVLKKFYKSDGGYRNARMEAIRAEQARYRQSQAAKGRASAQQRFNRGLTAVPTAVSTGGQPSDLRTPISDLQSLDQERKPSRASARATDPAFAEFWTAYPRKTGKGAALRAWAKAKPNLPAVLSALTWQCQQPQWTKDAGQFIPHPATWLNQGRWDDLPFDAPSNGHPARRWDDECQELHGGTCESRYLHQHKLDMDGVKSA